MSDSGLANEFLAMSWHSCPAASTRGQVSPSICIAFNYTDQRLEGSNKRVRKRLENASQLAGMLTPMQYPEHGILAKF
jgi:hypothetical protein